MGKVVKLSAIPGSSGPLTAKLLGEHVRAKRSQAKLRIEDAALLCGVAKETYSRIEKGKPGVRLEKVLQVCKMLGIQLYTGVQE